jgi:hypothetical protein
MENSANDCRVGKVRIELYRLSVEIHILSSLCRERSCPKFLMVIFEINIISACGEWKTLWLIYYFKYPPKQKIWPICSLDIALSNNDWWSDLYHSKVTTVSSITLNKIQPIYYSYWRKKIGRCVLWTSPLVEQKVCRMCFSRHRLKQLYGRLMINIVLRCCYSVFDKYNCTKNRGACV